MSDAVRTRASVRAAYERIASAYDERIPGGSPADDLFTDSERAFVLGRIGPDDEVLDVGCGTGRLAVPVATRARAVHGLDLTPAMIRVAAENARRAGVQVVLHEADMRHLPFPDQRFDVAMSHLALMHVDRSERPAVFAELSRVLRPGGRLLIGVKNRLFERMTGPTGSRPSTSPTSSARSSCSPGPTPTAMATASCAHRGTRSRRRRSSGCARPSA